VPKRENGFFERIDFLRLKNRIILSLYTAFPKKWKGRLVWIVFSAPRNPLTENLAAIEPIAAAPGQEAPAQWLEKVPSMLVNMLAVGSHGGELGVSSTAGHPQEDDQDHVQTAALETPSRPRDAVDSSDLQSGDAVPRCCEVIPSGAITGRLLFESPDPVAGRCRQTRVPAALPQAPSTPRGDVVGSAILVFCQEDFMLPGFRKAVCVKNHVKRTTLLAAVQRLQRDHEMPEVKRAAVKARDDRNTDEHAALLLELAPFKEFWPVELANPGAAKLPPKSMKKGAQNYLGSGVHQAEYLRVFDEMVSILNPETSTPNPRS